MCLKLLIILWFKFSIWNYRILNFCENNLIILFFKKFFLNSQLFISNSVWPRVYYTLRLVFDYSILFLFTCNKLFFSFWLWLSHNLYFLMFMSFLKQNWLLIVLFGLTFFSFFFSNIFMLVFLFLCYFFITFFFTLTRSFVTSRGMFYSFIYILFTISIHLLMQFKSMVILGSTCSWEGFFLANIKYMPELGFSFHLDCLAYFFMLLVVMIGFCTNIYILNYFKYEANEDIFILLINWFILSMLLLLIAGNLFTLFLGWELIGLTSFFLINFWSDRRGTFKSSLKAFSFNKVSDFFLFGFIILIFFLTQQSNIKTLNLLVTQNIYIFDTTWYICGLFLICCASIKSAQFIGHLWLPDSMEAPVPASALIHSATLVSAGIYFLLRFYPLLSTLNLHWVTIFLGALTAAYGGIVASAQTDMKKLLAYSTISHCGFLFICASCSNHWITIIYLFMHGLFKAMTFFSVGSFIRVANTQDTRRMGTLSRLIPVDTIFLIISAGNLGGLPFTIGFLYKHLFLLLLVNSHFNFIVIGLCLIGLLSSVVYTYRLVYYSAFDIYKGSLNLLIKDLQSNSSMDVNFWSFSTIIQSLVIFTMLFFSTLMFYIFIFYFESSGLILDNFPLLLKSEFSWVSFLELYGGAHIYLFYSLFILYILIICVVECRQEYTWQRKIHFLMYLIFFLVLVSFTSTYFISILWCV